MQQQLIAGAGGKMKLVDKFHRSDSLIRFPGGLETQGQGSEGQGELDGGQGIIDREQDMRE